MSDSVTMFPRPVSDRAGERREAMAGEEREPAPAAGGAMPGRYERLRSRLAPWRPAIMALVGIVVVILVWLAISRLIAEVNYDDVIDTLHATPLASILAALGLTALSFLALSIYDLSALRYLGLAVPYPIVALTAFCAYAVGNTAGFGPLTGGAIRYRFYSRLGVEPGEVAKIVAYVTVAFGLGLAGVTGLGLTFAAADLAAPLAVPPILLRLFGIAILVALGLLFALAARGGGRIGWRRVSIALPRPGLMLAQFGATIVDVSAAAAVLWVLLPQSDIGLPAFIAVYAVAIGVGVASHVPAGLGVFEAVILAVVGRSASVDAVLSALILYRVIYYGVPLLVASGLVTGLEVRRVASGAQASRVLRAGAQLSPRVLATLTFALGAVLVFSGVTPAADQRLDLLSGLLPLPILEGAHFLESVLGLGLIVVARGLAHRLDGAWWAAVIATGTAVLLSLLKAIAISESIALALLFIALLATRREFNRPASVLHQRLTPGWFLAITTVIVTAVAVMLFVYADVEYSNELWWQFEFSEEAPRSLRALLGVVIAAGSLATWSLFRPSKGKTAPPDAAEVAEAVRILDGQPYPDANLVRMGDKTLLFSEDRRAFIMFGRQAHSWVALFDPIGPRDAWPGLIWQFVEMARSAGGRAVFYQVMPENLALYADAGLRGFKLGEAAQVDLAAFDLKGAKRASLRHAYNRSQREGLSFEYLEPDRVAAVIDDLEAISNRWLAEHRAREKRFSLGAFERAYVMTQRAAIVRSGGRIVAFATVMTTGRKEAVTADLMRFDPGVPAGTMEFLFVSLMLTLRDQGYRWFDLGMAPLAGLSESPAAPIWHRMGRAVFEHGERFYNFHGLRAFKAKFQPEWQPRYMAVSGGMSPALALADVTVLISGGLKGVVGK